MKKNLLLAVFLAMFVGGLVFAVKGWRKDDDSAPAPPAVDESLRAEAEKRVEPVTLPPKPEGNTVEETVMVDVKKQVPVTRYEARTVAGGIKARIPRTVLETRVEAVPQKIVKAAGASQKEVDAWNAQVKTLEADRSKKVDAMVQQLAAEKSPASGNATVEVIVTLVRDAIVPLLTSVAGLLGAIGTFRKVGGGEESASKRRKGKSS